MHTRGSQSGTRTTCPDVIYTMNTIVAYNTCTCEKTLDDRQYHGVTCALWYRRTTMPQCLHTGTPQRYVIYRHNLMTADIQKQSRLETQCTPIHTDCTGYRLQDTCIHVYTQTVQDMTSRTGAVDARERGPNVAC